MALKIFTVNDSKAKAWGMPMILKSSGEAVRSFTDVANDTATMIGKHPEDFALFEIGEYCEQTGVITSYPEKISLGSALDYKH